LSSNCAFYSHSAVCAFDFGYRGFGLWTALCSTALLPSFPPLLFKTINGKFQKRISQPNIKVIKEWHHMTHLITAVCS
jgi:hypothetical protein